MEEVLVLVLGQDKVGEGLVRTGGTGRDKCMEEWRERRRRAWTREGTHSTLRASHWLSEDLQLLLAN